MNETVIDHQYFSLESTCDDHEGSSTVTFGLCVINMTPPLRLCRSYVLMNTNNLLLSGFFFFCLILIALA